MSDFFNSGNIFDQLSRPRFFKQQHLLDHIYLRNGRISNILSLAAHTESIRWVNPGSDCAMHQVPERGPTR